jgi:transcriptional regulator with XRE-family HTH domain
MKIHEFTIIASGLDPTANDFQDQFYDAGCDDATISFQKGMIIIEFAREAQTFSSALISACANVQRAGATIERIEPDYLVSLSDIANRAGLTRGAISLYAKGERAEGFPTPKARITSESPLWDWVEVSAWLFRRNQISKDIVVQARMTREANIVTEVKTLPRDNFVKRLEEQIERLEVA